MIRNEKESFVSSLSGRVDKVANTERNIARSVFSRKDTVIKVNGNDVKKSYIVSPGDEVSVEYSTEFFSGLLAEDIPLSVIYEDSDILVIDKEEKMVVHPAHGNWDGTLVNALISRYGEDFSSSDELRPGIVHRLDKDTSGTLVIAKNAESLKDLSAQFKEHSNKKYYLAIVDGVIESERGVIEKNIRRNNRARKTFETCSDPDGRKAKTSYAVLERNGGMTLVLVRIYTGRTHQIRVHMKSISHPVKGDVLYNRKAKEGDQMMLHSYFLEIKHPESGEKMSFRSPFPLRFKSLFPSWERAEEKALKIIEKDII